MTKHMNNSDLAQAIRHMFAENRLVIENISTDADTFGWYADVSLRGRKFHFGTDGRDGYTFNERKGSEYIHYSLDFNEPYFATDEKLLKISLTMIEAALSDPSFRGYQPKII